MCRSSGTSGVSVTGVGTQLNSAPISGIVRPSSNLRFLSLIIQFCSWISLYENKVAELIPVNDVCFMQKDISSFDSFLMLVLVVQLPKPPNSADFLDVPRSATVLSLCASFAVIFPVNYKIPPNWARNFKQSMGARNRVGIGLSYRPAKLHTVGWRN